MDFLDEAGNRDLAHRENKHWREVAEYDRYTVPLLVRLKSVDWPKLMALHRARWQRKGVDEMLARKRQYGCYCWGGFYMNNRTQRPRQIQRYFRLYQWFPVRTLALPIPTPVEYAQRLFELSREQLAAVYSQKITRERSEAPNKRQYLAERLKSISRVLSSDKADWEPQWQLKHFLEVGRPAAFQGYTDPANLGEVQAKLDYFWLCLREFHEAEKQVPPATPVPPLDNPAGLAGSELPAAVRKRLDYFPQLLTRLTNAPIWDTHEILDEALTHYKAGEDDLLQGQKFIYRLEHYLKSTQMQAGHRERIRSWAFSARQKEVRFINDIGMPEWKASVTEADRATLEHRLYVFSTTGRQIDQRDKDLDSDGANAANTERHIAQIEKRLAELNAALATTEPPQPDSPVLETPAPSPWGPLLTGLLELPALFEFFADCGLLSPTGELTALGKGTDGKKGGKAPWAGTLQALMKSRHLDYNVAAICRVLLDPAGRIQVRLNEGTLRDYSGKAGTYLDVANGYLKERGILRN